jgi:hypothetical protein
MSRELGQHRIGRPDIRRALRILRTGPAIEGIAPAMVGCFEGSELCPAVAAAEMAQSL